MLRMLTGIVLLLLVVRPSCAQDLLSPPDPLEASVAIVKRAAFVQPDGQHIVFLRSLRALGDPSLRPFFSRLARSDDLIIKVNGVLGLAETSDEGHADPWLIHRMESEVERLYAIEQAALFNLLKVEQIRTMLQWDDVGDGPRLALVGLLMREGESVDPEIVRALAASERETIRTVASCMLAHVTGDTSTFERERSVLTSLEARSREQALLMLLGDIGRYRLDGMTWWISELLRGEESDRVKMAALRAAMIADFDKGLALWEEYTQSDSSPLHTARMAILMLSMLGDHDVPADAFLLIRDDQPLNEAIADLGVAIARGGDVTGPSKAIIDLDQWQSSNHLLFVTERFERAEQVAVLAHYLTRIEASDYRRDDRVTLAIRAMTFLHDADPDAVATMLADAERDTVEREVILMGILASKPTEPARFASLIARRGMGRVDGLVTLLLARGDEALSDQEMKTLGRVAAGGARIAPAYQVQAAWLYLKRARRVEWAINQIFGTVESTN